MSGPNPDDMTKEELEEYITGLEKENDALKEDVAALTIQVHNATSKGRRSSGKEGDAGDEIELLTEENARLQDLLSTKEVEVCELKQAKIAAETRKELLDATKKQSDEEIVKLKKHVEELNSDIANLNKKNSSADNNTKEEAKALETDVAEFKRASVQEEHEKGILAHTLDGMQKEINQKVSVEVDNEREELERLKAEVILLQQKLRENNDVTERSLKEIEVLTHEKDDLLNWRQVYEDGHGLEELARSQRNLKEDKRRLGMALEQMSNKLSEVDNEREELERLKAEVTLLPQKLRENNDVTEKALKEIEVLTHEKDDLLNWRQVYEDGHGLQELAQSQRNLKEDKRRLAMALEKISDKLSEAEGTIRLLKEARDRLNKETGNETSTPYLLLYFLNLLLLLFLIALYPPYYVSSMHIRYSHLHVTLL